MEGDREAFAALYDLYARPVYLFLVGRLRAREEAEDALQATFLSAWRALPRLERPDRFARWLFRIARSRAADVRRRRSPAVRLVGGGEDLLGPDDGDEDPELGDVRDAVAALRPESRALLLLRSVEGWTAEEVAGALGHSASTVRRRHARILRHLRTRIERRRSDG